MSEELGKRKWIVRVLDWYDENVWLVFVCLVMFMTVTLCWSGVLPDIFPVIRLWTSPLQIYIAFCYSFSASTIILVVLRVFVLLYESFRNRKRKFSVTSRTGSRGCS